MTLPGLVVRGFSVHRYSLHLTLCRIRHTGCISPSVALLDRSQFPSVAGYC